MANSLPLPPCYIILTLSIPGQFPNFHRHHYPRATGHLEFNTPSQNYSTRGRGKNPVNELYMIEFGTLKTELLHSYFITVKELRISYVTPGEQVIF